MNYYERIQHSIDFIEDNLAEEITVEQCARQAYMSVSGYYRMFLSVVGYTVKEYPDAAADGGLRGADKGRPLGDGGCRKVWI